MILKTLWKKVYNFYIFGNQLKENFIVHGIIAARATMFYIKVTIIYWLRRQKKNRNYNQTEAKFIDHG